MSNTLWFDIKEYAPDRNEKDMTAENEALYRIINFMIHLTWEMPYSVVHGPVRDLALGIKNNVTREDWPEEFAAARDIMPAQLENFAELYSATLGTTVADLFTEEARGADEHDPALDRYALVEHAVEMRDALVAVGLDLCLPFIAAQGDQREGPAGKLVDRYQFDIHAPEIGGYTMMDLYIRPYRSFSDEGRAAIRWCKNNGIFSPPRGAKVNGTAQKHGNNWRCNPTTLRCYKQDHYFCVEDSHGNCSAMSG